ncbi:acetyltransferase, GNAT family protein [Zopfochytrium polystomum]|nr:acetyltransferase, GNAT family protein [Zopfochytrium polystomum]
MAPSLENFGTEIAIVSSPEQLDAAYAIRFEVFCDEQGFTREIEIDEIDPIATHFLLRSKAPPHQALGTARLSLLPPTAAHPRGLGKLGRLAVRKAARGSGAGRRLVAAVEEEARRRGVEGVVLSAQMPKVGFYEMLGYKPEGEEYDEDGAPHKKMVKLLD